MTLPTLRLLVDSYERLIESHAATLDTPNPLPREMRRYEEFGRGDTIVPRDQAEHDRLVSLAAAEDLSAESRRRKARMEQLEKQRERLERERKRLDTAA